MIRTALHVTLTPIVFLFGALFLANRLEPPAAAIVMLAAAVFGVWYGWRNRHR